MANTRVTGELDRPLVLRAAAELPGGHLANVGLY
jgi:hypothetical protein